jgi:PTS system galactitol-specific IIA component
LLEFNEGLVALDLEASDDAAVIETLVGKLVEHGLVSPAYGPATLAREREHPTGLPSEPFPIAIPHADADGVFCSSLAFASLKTPVHFKNMVEPDEDLDVQLVFILANKSPEEQITTLRNMALLFGQPDKLLELRGLATPEQAVAWLRLELGLNAPDETLGSGSRS